MNDTDFITDPPADPEYPGEPFDVVTYRECDACLGSGGRDECGDCGGHGGWMGFADNADFDICYSCRRGSWVPRNDEAYLPCYECAGAGYYPEVIEERVFAHVN